MGFAEDTIVRSALESLAVAARVEPRWRVRIEKRIPVAAGLGGGSSDAATAMRLANAGLSEPLDTRALHGVAATVGADVPFFLRAGAQVASAEGTELAAVELPVDYHVVLVVPHAETKLSTADRLRSVRRTPRRGRIPGTRSRVPPCARVDRGRARPRPASGERSRLVGDRARARSSGRIPRGRDGRRPGRLRSLRPGRRRRRGRLQAGPRRANDPHATAPSGRSRVNGKMSAAQWGVAKR